jgi:circadian clock protein KaiC
MIRGQSGTGKTTLAMQFLLQGERGVYFSFAESKRELEGVSEQHGWVIDEIKICELAADLSQQTDLGSSIFHAVESEMPEVLEQIYETIEHVKPTRIVIDPLSELKNIAQSERNFRRVLVQLKLMLERHGTTAIFVVGEKYGSDEGFESIAHGLIEMERETPAYGPMRRRIQVAKMRGRTFEEGFHDFEIIAGGLQIYPRVRPKAFERKIGGHERIKSGVAALDRLLGGGLDHGTSTLVAGPSGTGKSSVCLQYALAAAERGEHAVMYSFDEDTDTIRRRASSMKLELDPHLESGAIRIQVVDAAEMSPGRFSHLVRTDIEERDVTFIVLDSLNGYMHSMPSEKALVQHLHDLMTFVGNQGHVLMFTMVMHGLLDGPGAPFGHLSYLADTVLMLRYFEQVGYRSKSITAAKHRTGSHEHLIRQLHFGDGGVRLGDRLDKLTDVIDSPPSEED